MIKRKIFWYVGIITLLISIVINLFLLKSLHDAFLKLQMIRVFPVQSNNYQFLVQPKPYSELVIYGDSRAQMWRFTKEQKEQYHIRNLAVGGHTSSQTLLALMQSRTIPKSQIILLQLGINDLHWTGRVTAEKKKLIVKNLKSNINEIISMLMENDNKVIISTIFPPQKPPLIRTYFWPNDGLNMISQINQHIKKTSIKDNIILFDSFNILKQKNNNYLNTQYSDNDFFLHLNMAGYGVLNNELNKVLFKF